MTDRLRGQKEPEEPGRGPHCRSWEVPPSSLSHVICRLYLLLTTQLLLLLSLSSHKHHSKGPSFLGTECHICWSHIRVVIGEGRNSDIRKKENAECRSVNYERNPEVRCLDVPKLFPRSARAALPIHFPMTSSPFFHLPALHHDRPPIYSKKLAECAGLESQLK